MPASDGVSDLGVDEATGKGPQHVAIIMDGNGRWAESRGLPRVEGHRRGVNTVRMVTETAAELAIPVLTLYCLSSENWKRPAAEIEFLMTLLRQYLIAERQLIVDQNIRLQLIGRTDRLSAEVLAEVETTRSASRQNRGTRLVLAIDYGGRDEIVRAAARLAASGRPIDESSLGDQLDTAGLPDVDLMIRTGGDTRISNFLLWQASYAELWFTDAAWPEFSRSDFDRALADFRRRQRRFGGLG